MYAERKTYYTLFPWGQIWSEAFGDESDPFVLLVAGIGKQAIYWSTSFCKALAREGYYVVRFDHRDTGLSTHINFNACPYNYTDMIDDIRGVMKTYNQKSAHMFGSGMGGYLVQLLAINHPECVRTVALINSTYNSIPVLSYRKDYELPSSKPEVHEISTRKGGMHLNDATWFQHAMNTLRVLNGEGVSFDEEEWADLIAEERTRMSKTHKPIFFHHHVLAATLSKGRFESEKISKPTIIFHGAANPVILPQHAYATHQKIPNAELYIIEDMGHLHGQRYNSFLVEKTVAHWRKFQ